MEHGTADTSVHLLCVASSPLFFFPVPETRWQRIFRNQRGVEVALCHFREGSPVTGVKQGKGLLRKAEEMPSLEVFKTQHTCTWAGSAVGMAWPRCPLELPSKLNYPVVHLNVDPMSKAGFYLWLQGFSLQRCGISILECFFFLFIFFFFYIKPPKRHLPSTQYPHFSLAFCDFGSYFTISISLILAIWKPCSGLEIKHHLLLLVTSYETEPSPQMNTAASSFMAVATCSSGSLLSQAPCHSFTR